MVFLFVLKVVFFLIILVINLFFEHFKHYVENVKVCLFHHNNNYIFLCYFFYHYLIVVRIYFNILINIVGFLFSTNLYFTHHLCHCSHSKVLNTVLFCTVKMVYLGVKFKQNWVIHKVVHTCSLFKTFMCTQNDVLDTLPFIVEAINCPVNYVFIFFEIFFDFFVEVCNYFVLFNLKHYLLDLFLRF